MRIACVTHVDYEGPSRIAEWAKLRGHLLENYRPYKNQSLPPTAEVDLAVLMGGPQDAGGESQRDPYLLEEQQWIRDLRQSRRAVVGFCLGAQLVAEAFGAKTERSPSAEFGVFPVTRNEQSASDPIASCLPRTFAALHLHYDMPGVPEGATVLAHSEGCPRQMIMFGPRIYGFQFHLEMDEKSLRAYTAHHGQELRDDPFRQSEAELFKHDFRPMNQLIDRIFDRLVALPSDDAKLRAQNVSFV